MTNQTKRNKINLINLLILLSNESSYYNLKREQLYKRPIGELLKLKECLYTIMANKT